MEAVCPLIPLPVTEEPFQRIAMDIVGPLPKSRADHKYTPWSSVTMLLNTQRPFLYALLMHSMWLRD